MKNKNLVAGTLLVASLLGSSLAFYFWQLAKSPNVLVDQKESYIYIRKGTTFKSLLKNLTQQRIVNDGLSFAFVSKLMDYQEHIIPGRYLLQPDMDNVSAVRHLKSGKQAPLKLTFNNIRTKEGLAKPLCEELLADTTEFNRLLQDTSFLHTLGFDSLNIISMFIPNTYEVYWTTDAEKLFERMHWEYNNFWKQKGRSEKAKALGLTQQEVSTLASIVQKETSHNDEKPRVAGLYLNRLKRGMLLQADPTVVFANGEVGLKRILNKHLEVESPYNTYKHVGLPPGPIYMPDISSIDAVLNAEEHHYIFMCAIGDGSGYHNFARTNTEHNRNRYIYSRNLRKRGKR